MTARPPAGESAATLIPLPEVPPFPFAPDAADDGNGVGECARDAGVRPSRAIWDAYPPLPVKGLLSVTAGSCEGMGLTLDTDFSGLEAPSMALELLGIETDLVFASERSPGAVHQESF